MTITRFMRLALLAGVGTAGLLQPALALDAQAFVDRVAEVYTKAGYDLSFGPATLDGDTIVVDGVTVGFIGMEEMPEPMVLDTELTFSGVAELPDGGYTARSLTVPDIDSDFSAEPSGHISLRDIVIEGIYVPGGDTISAQALLQLVGALRTGPLTVTSGKQDVFSIAGIEAVSTFNPAQGSAELIDLTSSLAVNDIKIDLTGLGAVDPDAAAIVGALGLTTINGDITQSMDWTMADGHLVVDEFLFDFAELGALDIPVDMLGLTPAMLDKLYAMQAQTLEKGYDPESSEAQTAMTMAGMEIMQGLSLVSAAVRYDDASLAGKLLDFFAASSNIDRATFVAGLKAALPQTLAGLGVPALSDLLVPPVSAFLDDPQSLEIAARPASATPLLLLMAGATNPAALIPLINLTVTANQAAQ